MQVVVVLYIGAGRTSVRGGAVLGLPPLSLELGLSRGHLLVALFLLITAESSELLGCKAEIGLLGSLLPADIRHFFAKFA